MPGHRDRLCLMPWHSDLPKPIPMEQYAPELGESLGTVSSSARLAVGSFQNWSSPMGEFQCLRDHLHLKDAKYSCTPKQLQEFAREQNHFIQTKVRKCWTFVLCPWQHKRRKNWVWTFLRFPMDKKFQNSCCFVNYLPLTPFKAMQTSPALCLHMSYSYSNIGQWMMLRNMHIIKEFWPVSNVF